MKMKMEAIRPLLAEYFLVFLFTVTSFLSSTNSSELRFCHKGPQKVSPTECPYGIFFKEPIKTKCLYYAQDAGETSPQPVSYSADACGNSQKPLVPKTKLESTIIQKLAYGPDENGRFVASSGSPANDPVCIQECFDEVDPANLASGDEELPEYNFQAASCSPEMLDTQINTSEKLFDYLLFGQETEAKIPSNRLHQLLEKCALILLKHCGEPYIKSSFFAQAQEALKYLHFEINKSKVLELSSSDYSFIDERLVNCLNTPRASLKVTGIKCSTKAKIESIKYVQTNADGTSESRRLKYRVEPKSFRFGKFDIFIEAIWAALDFVHSFCFEEFRNSPYHMDMLVEHVGRIFSVQEIQERWFCPQELKNQDFWNNLAGDGDIKWTMRNVDFCAQAAAKASVFHYRLDRTFETDGETSDFILLGALTDKKGWNGTEDAYWRAYDTIGGVRNVLKASEEAFCPTNKKEFETFKQEQGLSC